MVENYTWERYDHVEDGSIVCLKCYCERELENEENWLRLDDATIDSLTFAQVRKAKHLIAVQMPVPKSITFFANTEMDSSSGGRLTGFSSSEDSPDGAVEELKGSLRRAMEEGHKRAILILDAAYQFSVSVGVYVDAMRKPESVNAGSNGNRRLEGGLVQEIKGIPKGASVEVRDYDVQETEGEDVHKDADGKPYRSSTWV